MKIVILTLALLVNSFVFAYVEIKEPIREQPNSYWLQVTDQLSTAAEDQQNVFEKTLPVLTKELKEFQREPRWLEFWGLSRNYNSPNDKTPIVNPKLLLAIDELMGGKALEGVLKVRSDDLCADFFHAGILHTYGYLFSNLRTGFGFKRERWILKTVEKGLGLPEGVWGPYPKSGNFLANTTYFAARIAFRHGNWIDRIENLDLVSPDLQTLDYSEFSGTRVEETVCFDDFSVTLYTDLIPFKYVSEQSDNTHLLIYSIRDSRESYPQLITLFPVGIETILQLILQDQGPVQDIKFRYNLNVPGTKEGNYIGIRFIN